MILTLRALTAISGSYTLDRVSPKQFWETTLPFPRMDRRRITITAVITILLGLLIYFQIREWRDFDWPTFWIQTQQAKLKHVLHGVGYIYIAYLLRAVRWQIFLRPVRKTSWTRLLRPTIIGFTGLALLGRPGELIRPYLIARREGLPFSSQLAVWTVERIFDVGAFTVLMLFAIFGDADLRELSFYPRFRLGGFLLVAGVAGVSLIAVLVARLGSRVGDWVELRFSRVNATLGKALATKVREFGAGLNTIDGVWAFVQLSIVSVGMWYVIALAYREVTHSYWVPILQHMTTSHVLLLMGSSMVGSILQLPAVGGGSQLATVAALYHIFGVPKELAVSCGMLLWIVTFVAVVPVGLALAHREHLSIRKLSKESAQP